MRRPRRTDVLLAASAGGHLDLLMAVAPTVVDRRARVWVTSSTSRGEALRAARSDVELIPEFRGSVVSALRNVAAAARIIARHRPRLVVTSGAGVVVPLCLLARLTGSRLVFVETMARVTSPSRTARLMSRVAGRILVQWPELTAELPGATVCEPALLQDVPTGDRSGGEGTFVAVGTHEQGFDRLLEIVDRAARDGVLPAPVSAQTGASGYAAGTIDAQPFVPGTELNERMRRARVVVCHGGAGIISSALAGGRTPIVVPRRAALREHIDDHQYQLTRKLAERGLVVLVEDAITAADVERATAPLVRSDDAGRGPTITEILRSEVDAVPAFS